MEPRRGRRQYRSCDPCRKSKRACDGEALDSSCSNCKRRRKNCTYAWLHAAPSVPRKPRQKATGAARAESASTAGLGQFSLDDFGQLLPDSPTLSFQPSSGSPAVPSGQPGSGLHSTGERGSEFGVSEPGLWGTLPVFNDPFGDGGQLCDDLLFTTDAAATSLQNGAIHPHPRRVGSDKWDNTHRAGVPTLGFADADDCLLEHLLESDCTVPTASTGPYERNASSLSFASDDLTRAFERLALTRNMFRIYHDSLENALSCWLTETTCPYSSVIASPAREWGPHWSNRICYRVHRLDRELAAVRGRQLTRAEEKRAARALLAAIVAFASQWATKRGQRSGMLPASYQCVLEHELTTAEDLRASALPPTEHFCREDLWDQAHHALGASAGVPSVKVMFANIILSLTQRPLHIEEQIRLLDSWAARPNNGGTSPSRVESGGCEKVDGLHDLFDNDCGPLFLDTAMRQLSTFRRKIMRTQRTGHVYAKTDSPRRSFSPAEGAGASSSGGSRSVLSMEGNDTFNLLFWLGIMFDTLIAAIHQRPLVVSDEESDISCPPAPGDSQTPWSERFAATLDSASTKNAVIWGDLFLHNDAANKGPTAVRWPCTYNEAAEILSAAAPVKVLLFRRLAHIQTLICRGAERERIEQAVQDVFRVYHHWNSTYGRFMLDCAAHHDSLPPRIQSWYIILAGHWHLGAMLLAETLETIDQAEIGMELQRESRRAMNIASTLRKDDSVAVANLARCSLRGQDPSFAKAGIFHDSVNERAFMTEPWTALLIRSLTKAGYNLLNAIDVSPHAADLAYDSQSEEAQRLCRYCLDALWCLGRKSDMALLAARVLHAFAEGRVRRRYSQVLTSMDNNSLSSISQGYDHEIPVSSIGALF